MSRFRPGRLGAAAAVVSLVSITACSSSSSKSSLSAAPSTTAAPQSITVHAGSNDPADQHISVRAFMPAQISVHVGTTVTWTWQGTIEPHSVSFYAGDQRPPTPPDPKAFAPVPATGPIDGTNAASSGLQPSGPAPAKPFSVSFAKAGTYKYYCVIHPTMVGTVTVTDTGGTEDSPQDVASRADTELKQYLAEGEAAAKELAAAAPQQNATSDGSTTWTVKMGTSTPHTDVMAFAPAPAQVKAGDKVTFLNDSGAPHTASFFNGKPAIQDPESPDAQRAIPGRSPQTLNMTDLFNTGVLPPNQPPGSGPPAFVRSYTYKVPAAGTYSYVCIFHASQGMTGTIVAG